MLLVRGVKVPRRSNLPNYKHKALSPAHVAALGLSAPQSPPRAFAQSACAGRRARAKASGIGSRGSFRPRYSHKKKETTAHIRYAQIARKLDKTQVLESGASVSLSTEGRQPGSGAAQTPSGALGWAGLARGGLWLLPALPLSFAQARGAGRMGELSPLLGRAACTWNLGFRGPAGR